MRAICIIFIILSFTCCIEKQKSENPPKSKNAALKPFLIAVLPSQGASVQEKRYKSLADYLSEALGMNVGVKFLDSYEAIYDEMLHNKVDAAVFGSLSYVTVNSKTPLYPLARPYRKDGISTYNGVIFARRDSGITEDVRTWKGKWVALVSKSTTAGYIFPRWYLYKHGIKDFEGYFGKVIYTGSHDAAVLAVFNKDADIGCASGQILLDSVEKKSYMRGSFAVLASSAPVPLDTFGVKKDMDSKLRDKLKNALLEMDKTPEGRKTLSTMGLERFIETKESEFLPILEMLNDLGLKPEALTLEAIGKF